MEALRQENSRLRRKIKANPTQKGKAKKTSDVAGSLVGITTGRVGHG